MIEIKLKMMEVSSSIRELLNLLCRGSNTSLGRRSLLVLMYYEEHWNNSLSMLESFNDPTPVVLMLQDLDVIRVLRPPLNMEE